MQVALEYILTNVNSTREATIKTILGRILHVVYMHVQDILTYCLIATENTP